MIVSSSVSSSGNDAPHSQLPMIAFVVFPPTLRLTRVTFGIGLTGEGVGGAFGAGVAGLNGPSALPRLSPSVFIAAFDRTIDTRARRLAESMLTTKSKVLLQLEQVMWRSSL